MEASTTAQVTPAAAASANRPAQKWLQRATPYLFILPTVLLVFLFTIWPTGQTVLDSLYTPGRTVVDPNTGERTPGPDEFVGLENYRALLFPTDPPDPIGSRFPRVLGNTLLFAGVTVVLGLPLSLLMALLLNRRVRGLAIWRFAFFYPALLPMIGAANIWAFMFANTVGLINTVLRSFGLEGQDWVGDPNLVLYSVTLVNIWKQAGFYMIFYLAGLQSIPRDIYEAADLDGASTFAQFFYITLPLLRRTTLFVLVIAATYAFQTVEQLQALNFGLPADRGNLILYFIFQNIGSRRSLGLVNAMTVILIALLLIFTVANFVFFEGRGKEQEA
ncbi:MAG: sugar ABC transporter permease [Anaerolineae bacterium]